MRLAIMQPYFFPYLGYFQLIQTVDVFVIYDNIKYTKKGWINRNRFLCEAEARYFTVALEKASDNLDVRDRHVSKDFERNKIKRQIEIAYKKAPYFQDVFALFCNCIDYEDENLFRYIFYSLQRILDYLSINTKVIVSSMIDINHALKNKQKVIEICKATGACEYINPIGGMELYDKQEFQERGIKLSFLKMDDVTYKQFGNVFVPNLSIVDVMMFNSPEAVRNMLGAFTLI